jgi:hypothetical protein
MAERGRVICLPDDQFIVAEAALAWLESEGYRPIVLQSLNRDDVIQARRNSLAHTV